LGRIVAIWGHGDNQVASTSAVDRGAVEKGGVGASADIGAVQGRRGLLVTPSGWRVVCRVKRLRGRGRVISINQETTDQEEWARQAGRGCATQRLDAGQAGSPSDGGSDDGYILSYVRHELF